MEKKKIRVPATKEKPVGKITHYFSKLKVAVIKLAAPLSEGSKIRIVGGEETDFKQAVKSMQSDHKPVKRAKKGAEIGMKVNKKVREGYKVYKA
jgi:U32 family peptidase